MNLDVKPVTSWVAGDTVVDYIYPNRGVWADETLYSTYNTVQEGGVIYECFLGHTSSTAANKPGSGTNWAAYWHVKTAATALVVSKISDYKYEIRSRTGEFDKGNNVGPYGVPENAPNRVSRIRL